MQFDSECVGCLFRREYDFAMKQPQKEKMPDFLADCAKAIANAPKNVSAPYLIPQFAALIKKYYGIDDVFAEVKKQSNRRVLAILPKIRSIVAQSDDPLLMAMKFSRTGNFLDFAVLGEEKIESELDAAIKNTPEQEFDPEEYTHFCNDVSTAKEMLILGDNAGEIGFDVVLVEQLKKQYPDLQLAYVVRGANAQNDATREDAAAVGMDRLIPILDNGSAIPATELAYCSPELLNAMKTADVILAKGQANFESMLGCDYNVYYTFLCKCARLGKILHKPLLQGMFINDLRIRL